MEARGVRVDLQLTPRSRNKQIHLGNGFVVASSEALRNVYTAREL